MGTCDHTQGTAMIPSEDRHRAREPSPQSNDSAGTSLACCRRIGANYPFARLDTSLRFLLVSNSASACVVLINQRLLRRKHRVSGRNFLRTGENPLLLKIRYKT